MNPSRKKHPPRHRGMFRRVSQYRTMWILVLYDLPTETKRDRQEAAKFRKSLLKAGFAMFQFSSYLRYCTSRENAETHIQRVRKALPRKGKVGILRITDKQFGMIEIYHGTQRVETQKPVQQLEFF